MNIRNGNLWNHQDEADLILVTTNGTVRSDGRLVMGTGIAKEAQMRYPEIAKWFGKKVKTLGSKYHLLIHPEFNKGNWYKIGAFQTKIDWSKDSSPQLIQESLDKLYTFAKDNPNTVIFLNFPGIGFGGLPIQTVTTLIRNACLPENVIIWKQ